MTNMRPFWWMALGFTLLWIWIQWENFVAEHQNPQPAVEQSAVQAPPSPLPKLDDATRANAGAEDLPALPATRMDITQTHADGHQVTADERHAGYVRVITDVLDIKLSTQGGDVRYADLLDYPIELKENPADEQPFGLMRDSGSLYFVAQGGLISSDASQSATHKQMYRATQDEYIMDVNARELRVPLTLTANGVQITKTYVFKPGAYDVVVEYTIDNQSGKTWDGSVYSQVVRNPFDNTGNNQFLYTYTGAVVYTQEDKYQKYDFGDIESQPLKVTTQGGWAAMIQHYFVVAALPHKDQANQFYTRLTQGNRYQVGSIGPRFTVDSGQTQVVSTRLFMGPKLQNELAAMGQDLDLTVDFGMWTVISKPIFWLLDKIHSVLGNWGWAIIVLTILIKLLFWPLASKAYRSMANMRELAPKLKQLKERYGDDKVKFQQKMMEMYKTEKINPLGGCLPMLVQIPVFIALYWVLLESVELRQAPFMLWIDDMSQMDPYFVLPLLMGVSMYVQQKLNPAPMDEMQAKMMQILPFIFTFFFLWFPAGLVLYWLVNNILSISQQWYITQKIHNEKAAAKHAG